MARLVRENDWASSALGPPNTWPERLKAVVELVLASPLVSTVVCGPERVLIYNDATASLYGAAHPGALGRPLAETFPDSYPVVAPLYDRAFAGEAVQVEAQPLDVSEQGGEVFESYLVPVRDHAGDVMAVHMVGFEVGRRLAAEKALAASREQDRFLLKLSDALRSLDDATDIQAATTAKLRERFDAGWCYYVEWNEAGTAGTVLQDATREGLPSLVGEHDVSDVPDYLDLLRTGRILNVPDFAGSALLSARIRQRYAALGFRSMLGVPLVKGGQLRAMLLLGDTEVRRWTGDAVALIQETAERTWAAVERARAEAAFHQSEARYRALVEASASTVWTTDAQGKVVEDSPSWRAFTGQTLEAWLGSGWLDAVHPEDRGGAGRRWAEAVAAGRPLDTELRLRHAASGGWRLTRARAVPLRGANGAVVSWVGMNLDIDEARRAETALRESEERFRVIVETARDYAIFTTDAEGRIETWPRGAQEVFGWTAEEAVGRSVDMTFTPEDRARDLPAAERREAREQGQSPDVRWHLRKDGSRIFIDGVTRPLGSPDDASAGFVKVGQDVTERRATEERLRESEERFRQFGEASSDVLWIRDAETLAFEYISPAFEKVYGMARQDLLTGNQVRRWMELMHPADRIIALDHLRRVRAGGGVMDAFRIMRRADGEVRWIRDTGFPLLDAEGRVQRVAGIGHDATEEVELQDRLRVLVAELQHRSRNLVSVVQGVSERTLATSSTLEDFRTRFRARLAALGRVNALLSRLREGDRITFDQLLQAELAAHGVVNGDGHGGQVTLRGPVGVALRSATVQTFALALHELATNALKYGALSRPEGHLEVAWDLLSGKDGERQLRVDWREAGVPPPAPGPTGMDETPAPRRRGYGLELIERALPYQLRAQTSYRLTTEGVRCTIVVPVSSTLDLAFSSEGGADT